MVRVDGGDVPSFREGFHDAETDATCTSGDKDTSTLKLSSIDGLCEVNL
jgi:hypothetical protein